MKGALKIWSTRALQKIADRKWRWDSRTTFQVFQFFPHDKNQLDNTSSSLLKNKPKKYESCIRKQFGTEDAGLWRGTPFKTCRLLIAKKKKQSRSLGLPIDFSGIARELELSKFLWPVQRTTDVEASGKGNRFHSSWGHGDCLHRLVSLLWRKGTLKAGFEKEFFLTSFFKSIWERKWRALQLGFGAIRIYPASPSAFLRG